MILFEYDEEAVLKAYAKDAEARGIAKGKAEGEKAKGLQIAKAMLAKGIDLDTTSQCTGISIDELKKFK